MTKFYCCSKQPSTGHNDTRRYFINKFQVIDEKDVEIVHFGYTQGLLMLTEKMKYFFYYYPSEEFINKATDYIIGNVS